LQARFSFNKLQKYRDKVTNVSPVPLRPTAELYGSAWISEQTTLSSLGISHTAAIRCEEGDLANRTILASGIATTVAVRSIVWRYKAHLIKLGSSSGAKVTADPPKSHKEHGPAKTSARGLGRTRPHVHFLRFDFPAFLRAGL
jgi:hypothetical protein